MDKKKSVRTAIVTGGTRGLGREIVLELNKMGYSVIAICQSTTSTSESFQDLTKNEVVQLDLNSVQQIDSFFDSFTEQRSLEVLVNNASPSYMPTPFRQWEIEDVKKMIDVNVVGAFRMIQRCIPFMKKSKRGRIINILTSGVSDAPSPGSAGYTVAKYGLLGLTYAVAAEYSKYNIHCNGISPGAINCGIYESWPDILKESVRKNSPGGKILEATDVAKKVAELVSRKSDDVNGHNFRLS